MATNPTVNRSDLFARYESALTGLANIPRQLERDLAEAQAVYDTAIATAATSVMDEEQRLARLRQNITTRFSASAETLRDANVLVPRQVRAAAGQKGDPSSLAAAVSTQYEAEKAVEFELQTAANAAKLRAAGDKSQVAAAQEAAEALRRRQEKIRKTRAETQAEAESKRVEEEKSMKQKRLLMMAGAVGLLILLAILAAVLH